MNAFQIRNYDPFYGNGIHVLLQRGNDISKYIYTRYLYIQGYFSYNISLGVSWNSHTNNIVSISIMLHFECIDYFTGKLKSVETFLTSVASVNDVN